MTVVMCLVVSSCAVDTTESNTTSDTAAQDFDVTGSIVDQTARVYARQAFANSELVNAAKEFLQHRGIEVDTTFHLLGFDTTARQGESFPILTMPSPIAPITPDATEPPSITKTVGTELGVAASYIVVAMGLGGIHPSSGLPTTIGLIQAAAVPKDALGKNSDITNIHAVTIDIGESQEETVINVFSISENNPTNATNVATFTAAEARATVIAINDAFDAKITHAVAQVLNTIFAKPQPNQTAECSICRDEAIYGTKLLLQGIIDFTLASMKIVSFFVLGLAASGYVVFGGVHPLVIEVGRVLERVAGPAVLVWLGAIALTIGYGLVNQQVSCHDVC